VEELMNVLGEKKCKILKVSQQGIQIGNLFITRIFSTIYLITYILITMLKFLSIKELCNSVNPTVAQQQVGYIACGSFSRSSQYPYITSSATSFAPYLLLCTAICNC
jgi:hypothetical protein